MPITDWLALANSINPRPDDVATPGVTTETATVESVEADGTATISWSGGLIPGAFVVQSVIPGDTVQVLMSSQKALILGSGGGTPGSRANPYAVTLHATTADPVINGTANGWWAAAGSMVDVEFDIVFGAGMDPGTGEYTVNIPFACGATDGTPVGQVHLIDATDDTDPANRRMWSLIALEGQERLAMRGTGNTTSRAVTDAVPWTFAAGHRIQGTARYRTNIFIPSNAPFLLNVTQGHNAGATTTSQDVPLTAGTADKIIIVCQAAPSGGTTFSTPTDWTRVLDMGAAASVNVAVFVRENTADTLVPIVTSGTARLIWFTAHVIGGDVLGTLTGFSATSGGATQDPPAVVGALSTWLGIGMGIQHANGASVNAPIYPAALPFERRFEVAAESLTIDMNAAMATGPFDTTTTVDPGVFTFDAAHNGRGFTFAIPAAT